MKAGDLILTCTGPEERFTSLVVDTQDPYEADFEYLENNRDFANYDSALTNYNLSTEPLSVKLDGGKPMVIKARYQDSSQETEKYRIVIVIAVEYIEAPQLIEI